MERFDLMQQLVSPSNVARAKLTAPSSFLNAKNADGSPMSLDEVKSELLLVMYVPQPLPHLDSSNPA